MEKGRFFALLARAKYIDRWGLMRRTRGENLAEHTLDTVYITHALTLIHNRRCGGCADVEKAVLIAAYHDVAEIFTGDLPTPVKYKNEAIAAAYRSVEASALQRLCRTLPDDLAADYNSVLMPEHGIEYRLAKAADKISALLKCREEISMGNEEFRSAQKTLTAAIKALNLPAADIFVAEYAGYYSESIDDLTD